VVFLFFTFTWTLLLLFLISLRAKQKWRNKHNFKRHKNKGSKKINSHNLKNANTQHASPARLQLLSSTAPAPSAASFVHIKKKCRRNLLKFVV